MPARYLVHVEGGGNFIRKHFPLHVWGWTEEHAVYAAQEWLDMHDRDWFEESHARVERVGDRPSTG